VLTGEGKPVLGSGLAVQSYVPENQELASEMLEHRGVGCIEISINPELLLDGGVGGLLHFDPCVDLPVREFGMTYEIVEYLLLVLRKFAHCSRFHTRPPLNMN